MRLKIDFGISSDSTYYRILLAIFTLFSIFSLWVEGFEKPTYCKEKRHKRGKGSTFLWRIKRRPASYFFGTIHVPYTVVWDYIHPKAKRAFRKSDAVFLELDLSNPQTLRTLAMCQLLPNDSHLKTQIPGDLYNKIEKHMNHLRLALRQWVAANEPRHNAALYAERMFANLAGNWRRKRPVWIMLLLNSLTMENIKNRKLPVLDLHLAQEAISNAKFLGAIENATEQCHPLNLLNETHILYILNQTLSQDSNDDQGLLTNQDRLSTKQLIEHYNCGSLDEKIFTKDSIQLPDLAQTASLDVGNAADFAQYEMDEYFRRELIVKRNFRMAERVAKLLQSNPDRSFFFAFGAGHFLGRKDSVVDLVRQLGFVVEQVPSWRRKRKSKDRHKMKFKAKTDKWMIQKTAKKVRNKMRVELLDQRRQRNFNELWIRKNRFVEEPKKLTKIDDTRLEPAKNVDSKAENFVMLQFAQLCINCSKNLGLLPRLSNRLLIVLNFVLAWTFSS